MPTVLTALPVILLACACVSVCALAAVLALLFACRRRLRQSLRNFSRLADELSTRSEAIDAARRMRHDARHHRMAVADLLLRGRTDRALAYIEELDGVAERHPTDKFVWCENEILNAVLSGFAREAAAKGVRLEVAANVGKRIPVPDTDLVSVFANLLENAIGAAGRMEGPGGGSDRVVRVSLRQRERTFGGAVENPVPEGFALSERGLPCVTEGTGLRSVFESVARNGGECVYSLADGKLTCQVVLRFPAERAA